MANFINVSSNSEYSIPLSSHNFGYILVIVKPGIVFISLRYISSVSVFTKKSTLEKPFPSIALKAFTASFLTFSANSLLIFAGIITSDLSFLYFASYE